MALKVMTMAELRREVLMKAERTGLTVAEISRHSPMMPQSVAAWIGGSLTNEAPEPPPEIAGRG